MLKPAAHASFAHAQSRAAESFAARQTFGGLHAPRRACDADVRVDAQNLSQYGVISSFAAVFSSKLQETVCVSVIEVIELNASTTAATRPTVEPTSGRSDTSDVDVNRNPSSLLVGRPTGAVARPTGRFMVHDVDTSAHAHWAKMLKNENHDILRC